MCFSVRIHSLQHHCGQYQSAAAGAGGGMYDPRNPNVFSFALANDDSDEEQERERDRAAAKAKQHAEEEQEKQKLLELHQQSVASSSSASGGITADDLRRRRLEISARLGIDSAKRLQQEEEEVRHRQQKFEGLDSGSKVSKLMSLMGGGKTDSLSAPLQLGSSTLSAGGHSIVEAPKAPAIPGLPLAPAFAATPQSTTSATAVRTPQGAVELGGGSGARGRPSSLLRLLGIATEQYDPSLADAVAEECRQYGHVRSVKVVIDQHQPARHPPYVFIQFDTVTSGFKAAEALHGRSFDGRGVSVEFYPQATFEKDVFDAPV